MSEQARQVRIEIRHHTLASAATLTTQGDGRVFIALDEPPPVRSILAVSNGDGAPQAIEVVRVVEVDADGATRGVFGRPSEDTDLAVPPEVGTEHLQPGEPVATLPQDADLGALPVPAPVVDPDPSERIDTREIDQLEGTDDAPDEGDDDGSDETSDSEERSEGGEAAPSRVRPRRGRKQR